MTRANPPTAEATMTMEPHTVDIWFDIACPWCYIGKAEWDAAVPAMTSPAPIQVRWRSFELRPDQPPGQSTALTEIMAQNYNMSADSIDATLDRIRRSGSEYGITLRPERVRPTNTFDAHRLVQLARGDGLDEVVIDRLFAACHADLADISEHAVLLGIAREAGLDHHDVQDMLDTERLVADVRHDERLAGRTGVSFVPSARIDTGRPRPLADIIRHVQGWSRGLHAAPSADDLTRPVQ